MATGTSERGLERPICAAVDDTGRNAMTDARQICLNLQNSTAAQSGPAVRGVTGLSISMSRSRVALWFSC